MTLETQKTLWIRRVLEDVDLNIDGSTPIRSDNKSPIAWETGERCPYGRAKHTEVRVNFIQELLQTSKLDVFYVSTEENGADVLINPLGRGLHEAINERLRL